MSFPTSLITTCHNQVYLKVKDRPTAGSRIEHRCKSSTLWATFSSRRRDWTLLRCSEAFCSEAANISCSSRTVSLSCIFKRKKKNNNIHLSVCYVQLAKLVSFDYLATFSSSRLFFLWCTFQSSQLQTNQPLFFILSLIIFVIYFVKKVSYCEVVYYKCTIKQNTFKCWYLLLKGLDSAVASSGFRLFALNFNTELFVFLGQPGYLGRYRISSQLFRVEEQTRWVTLKPSCTKTISQLRMVLYLWTSVVALILSALIPQSRHPSQLDSCWAWQPFLQLPWVWLGRSQLIHWKRVVFFFKQIHFGPNAL